MNLYGFLCGSLAEIGLEWLDLNLMANIKLFIYAIVNFAPYAISAITLIIPSTRRYI